MTTDTKAGWTMVAVLVGRLIFAALFIMAASFKLMDINATATRPKPTSARRADI